MAAIDSSTVGAFLAAPLALPVWLVGVFALLVVVLAVAAWRRARAAGQAWLWSIGGILVAVVALAVAGELIARMDAAAGRRALLARAAALDRAALTPGSALSCIDAGAGETVEDGCEKTVFASAQSTAGAVAYMDARLTLLSQAAGQDDEGLTGALAATRRAVTLDRYGIAAHVLAMRDGCTASQCAAFALVDDDNALKANMKAQVFDQYVSRYASSWNAPGDGTPAPVVSAVPAPQAPAVASAAPGVAPSMPAPVKPGQKWDFPSADSIPAVSIMDKEPPLPKATEADGKPDADGQSKANAKTNAKPNAMTKTDGAQAAEKPPATAPRVPPPRPPQAAQEPAQQPAAR